jgi:pyruvate,orthophosphate dikinase
MREMILADTVKGRKLALAKLLPMQRSDFEGIFREMEGLPVTIRLLDPPLHEFVPQQLTTQKELAENLHISLDSVKSKLAELHEFNPMMGHRGCRLGNTYPEITEMQTTAILEAALDLKAEGITVIPEIMVPLVGISNEFEEQNKIIRATAKKIFEKRKDKVEFLVGTMIEVPRAALTAGSIARHADFFSFGTNDLTQFTFGYSRDDAGKFLKVYLEEGILKDDPFEILDQEGVGRLVTMATEKGRNVKPKLKLGLCGEHGGEPSSIDFCHRAGLDYVSCSPYRVPIARVSAAQAALAATLGVV